MTSIVCACGCGESIPVRPHHKSKPPRYVHGHNRRGVRSATWKGGRIKHGQYWEVWAPDHPRTGAKGYVKEHRLVWEQTHGRLLEPWEHIHHIDGDPGNNDPSNLVALSFAEHLRAHRADPRYGRNQSKKMKKIWADPAFREKRRKGHKAALEKRGPISDEARARYSAASKRQWLDPKMRERMADKARRERISASLQKHFKSPDARKAASDRVRRSWITRRARKQESVGH